MADLFPYRADFLLEADKKALKAIYYALLPETGDSGRTGVKMALSSRGLLISISAADAVALRAAINSYLRWSDEALRVYEASHRGRKEGELFFSQKPL